MPLIKSISGIRGTIGGKPNDALTPIDVIKFASAYGTMLVRSGANPLVVIGRDARPTGESIARMVAGALQNVGISVIDLGLSTTPTVELEVSHHNAGGGIIITASHNPVQWNALKLLNHLGEFISAEDGEELLRIAENEDFDFVDVKKAGSYTTDSGAIDRHIEKILAYPLVDREAIAARNFRVVVDAVNSSGGIAVPKLLEALGVNHVTTLFAEPTGFFEHNPEPLPENLVAIAKELQRGNFDLGIVVDPDVDRLALLNEDGTFFGEEYTLVAIADYVLKHKKGNTVSNLSSTRALQDVTEKHGGSYLATAVGEVNVVKGMKATKAVIGGEGNGGIIVPDFHYGRDALIGIALFLSHLAKFGKSISVLRKQYPNYYISKNKIELSPEININKLLEEIVNRYKKNPINQEDGVRIEFDKQWVHLRKSNTEPIIRIYAESDSEVTSGNIANKIISDIKEVINHRESKEQ